MTKWLWIFVFFVMACITGSKLGSFFGTLIGGAIGIYIAWDIYKHFTRKDKS